MIAQLQAESIQYLVDVRSNPWSKYSPEFNGKTLSGSLQRVGIKYVPMGDCLGGRPSDPSCYEDGHVIYDRVRSKAFFRSGIERLLSAVGQEYRVCLLCTEADPAECHRSKLIGEALQERGVELVHLCKGGGRLSQAEVMTSMQANLFGAELQSRKAYRPKTAVAYASGSKGHG